MKFDKFLQACKRLNHGIDNDVARLKLTDDQLDNMDIDLDLSRFQTHMQSAQAKRKLKTLGDIARINKTILELRKNGARVDFGPVAEAAHVSDPTVRKYFGAEVKRLRKLPTKSGTDAVSAFIPGKGGNASDESKNTIIVALRQTNKKLIQDKKRLEEENVVLLSRVVELDETVARLKRLSKQAASEES